MPNFTERGRSAQRGRVGAIATAVAMSLALGLAPAYAQVTQSVPAPAPEMTDDTDSAVGWVYAETAEIDAAKGGNPVLLYYVVVTAAGVVKVCAKNACAGVVIGSYKTVKLAQTYACKKYRRFC